jgi:hypothetical protein
MMMMQLAFDNMKWSTPAGSVATLDADPSILCPSLAPTGNNGDGYVYSDFATFSIMMIWGAALLLLAAGFLVKASRVKDKEDHRLRNLSLCCACPGTILFLVGIIGVAASGVWGGLFIGSLSIFLIFGIGFVGVSAVAIEVRDAVLAAAFCCLCVCLKLTFYPKTLLPSGKVRLPLPRF